MVGTIAFAIQRPVQLFLGFDEQLTSYDQLVVVLMGANMAVRMAASNAYGAYRASLQFARGTIVIATVEVLRVLGMIAALVVAPGLLAPAAGALGVSVAAYMLFIPLDIGNRLPAFRYGLARPTHVTTHRAFSQSLLFSANYLPSVVLLQIPVLIIGNRAASGILAAFILMRTISNLVRTVVQRFSYIIGMELSRLEAQQRKKELAQLYASSANVAAYLFGFSAALLLVWGDTLLRLWTGSSRLYDPLLLAIMLAPLVFTPRALIAVSFATFSNRPGRLALAVVLQTALAGLLALTLPIRDVALRFTVAIYFAEIATLAPIIYHMVARELELRILMPAFVDALQSLSIGGIIFVLARALRSIWPGWVGMFGSSALLGLLMVPPLLLAVRPLYLRHKEETGEVVVLPDP